MSHRFFVSPASLHQDQIRFDEPQAHQLRDVLRMRGGERIIVLDNAGSEYVVELTKVTPRQVCGQIIQQRRATGEPRTYLILYQALLKADKFEWVLQKGTEIGISEFVPVVSARSIGASVGRTKYARWMRIICEAAEQAGRGKLPLLHTPQPFPSALQTAHTRGGLLLMPWEQEHTMDLHAILKTDLTPLQLFIGPEGGFAEAEAELARAHGVVTITLGPRILRAETAGLVATSAILYHRGDLGAG